VLLRDEPHDDAQKSGLAAAGRAQDCGQRAVGDEEIDP